MQIDSVKKRHVFYLSGYDPRGAGHYHRLYKAQAARQGALTGHAYDVTPRKRMGDHLHRWQITTRPVEDASGAVTETVYDFLAWDDIIRAEWANGISGVAGNLWTFVTDYIKPGYVWDFGRPSWRPLIAGLYPVVYAALSLLLSFGVMAGIYMLLTALLPAMFLVKVAALCAGMAGFVFTLRAAYARGERLAAFWLLRIYIFSLRWGYGQVKGIDDRIAFFAGLVAEALKDPSVDEVVISAHSVGAMLALPMIARALEQAPGLQPGKLKLLTLGACIPLISYHADAGAYRRDLSAIAHDARLAWTDYSAKGDGACFYLLNPVTGCGLPLAEGAGPILLSPRFFKHYLPENYRKIRYDWYGIHFLYLMSTDVIGDYDYFKMTAGISSLKIAPQTGALS